MAAPIRIKRRAAGNPGAPAELLNAELAFNEVDNVLYYGRGTGGENGTATTVIPIAGPGAFVALTGNQTINGIKTFTNIPKSAVAATADDDLVNKKFVDDLLEGFDPGTIGGYMLKSVYDPTDSGKVLTAVTADTALAVIWDNVSNKPTAFPPSAHTHTIAEVTNLQTTLNQKANLANPVFTGNPTAPTPVTSSNSTSIATTAFVVERIESLIGASPEALDTLQEIAEALGNDPNFAGTMTTELAKKAEKAANLSDLANIATARTNLGLGTLALQNANAVAITGGTIDNITIDGGIF